MSAERSETNDDEHAFQIDNCTFDEASLRSLLEAAKKAGINLSGIQAELLPDGRYLVNNDPAAAKGPARDQ